jgi:hypothetical protein
VLHTSARLRSDRAVRRSQPTVSHHMKILVDAV